MMKYLNDSNLHLGLIALCLVFMVLEWRATYAIEPVRGPCAILRDNLWRAGIHPAKILDMQADCISNVEQRRIRVLREASEIEAFRNRNYIAPPALVEKKIE